MAEWPSYPRIKDVYESASQKYLYKNAFDNGYSLPTLINDLIGYGSFCPLRKVSDLAGNPDIAMAVGFAKINSDIYMSLSTPLGTRFMNPEFGSELHTLLFEPYDSTLFGLLQKYTIKAIEKDVRKIKLIDTLIDDSLRDYNLLKIGLRYNLINSQVENNFVYPFVTGGEQIRS
jgi:phage baseplate assembly protein W